MATKKTNKTKKARRAVVVAGRRTPFVKAFGDFLKLDTIDLGHAAVSGLLEATGLPHHELDALVWGGVILPSTAPRNRPLNSAMLLP